MSPAAFSCSQRPCFHVWCVSENCDERHQTFQPGRQALVSHWSAFVGSVGSRGLRALLRRVTLPVQLWRACGQPAAFRPQLPWWQPFVFSYLSVTGWLRRPRIQPGVTEPTLALGRGQARWPWSHPPAPTRQVSARFRPRTMTDSPVCTRSTPCRIRFADSRFRSIHSDGRKLSRQSGYKSCAPEDSRGRDAPHIGQKQ